MNLNNNCYIVCLLVRLCLRHPTPFPSAPQAGWDATKEAANPPSGTVSGARKWSWSRSARSLRSLHSRLRRVLTMRGVGGKVPNGIRFQVLRVPTASKAYGSLRSLSLRHLTYETERDMNRMPDEPRSDWKWMTTAPYIPGLVASLVVRSFRALFVRPSLTIRYASRFISSFFTSSLWLSPLRSHGSSAPWPGTDPRATRLIIPSPGSVFLRSVSRLLASLVTRFVPHSPYSLCSSYRRAVPSLRASPSPSLNPSGPV